MDAPWRNYCPMPGYDAAAARLAIASMRALRTALARRGVRLTDILKRGENLRELTHDDHRY